MAPTDETMGSRHFLPFSHVICVHKEEEASAESTEGTRQLSILCVRPLLERDSTLDVKHPHLPKLTCERAPCVLRSSEGLQRV